jgi:MoaA/NifB/PqqE/SkfB family radical SAM enzyme
VTWQAMKQRALAAARPLSVHLELTYRCNWRCLFCYNPRHSDVRALSVDEWCTVFDDLRELGTLTITLTGGEPLAHRDFFAIAAAARERRFAIRIFTNAALIDDDTAERIVALHPLSVEVSIHGATAEVHDRATARPGSFDDALAGIDRLRARGLPAVLKMPLTSMNEHQIDDIVGLAVARDLQLHIDPHLTPRDDGDQSPLTFAPSADAVRRVYTLIRDALPHEERTRGGSNCGVGRLTMAIDPEGNVFPCIQWRHQSLGNIRSTRLRDLWHSSGVRQEAASISVAANDALIDAGETLASFPYCPAIAAKRSGDPLQFDDSFRRAAEIAAELR